MKENSLSENGIPKVEIEESSLESELESELEPKEPTKERPLSEADLTLTSRLKNLGYDLVFGGTIAVVAAFVAFGELGASKYGEENLAVINEKAASYSWYQAKSIKESLVEGQRDLLKSLVSADSVAARKRGNIDKQILELDKKLQRYKKEKNEILLGSKQVGEANWVQDIDGKYGQVVGSKELEARASKLGMATDRFDFANIFLQLSLVFGAVGIIVRLEKAKTFFFGLLLTLGVVGMLLCFRAWIFALNI